QASVSEERREAIGMRAAPNRNKLVALDGMQPKHKANRLAGIRPSRIGRKRGFLIDYQTLNTGQTNYVLKGDMTYFISGNVSLFGTNTTFEGGTVLKYTNNVTLTVSTPITWQGSAYRPVILTARDDPSVGESIAPSNALSGYYATTALYFDANAAGATATLPNLRVANAQTAIGINGRAGHVISHAQLVTCQKGFAVT